MNLDFLKNPMIEKLALGKLKKACAESGTKAILVTVSETGSFDFTPYTEAVKVLTVSDYNAILSHIKFLEDATQNNH